MIALANENLNQCLRVISFDKTAFARYKKAEELRAWISESQAWTEFSRRDASLAQRSEPLVKRENYIAKLRAKSGVQGVRQLIATNPVYAGLN